MRLDWHFHSMGTLTCPSKSADPNNKLKFLLSFQYRKRCGVAGCQDFGPELRFTGQHIEICADSGDRIPDI